MNGRRYYKPLLALVMVALLASASWSQLGLNRSREELGLTRVKPLENAPPVLAFTTVALGGFRGLIANVLWIRANELQLNDKYFEMVQLADWITKLQPHFIDVWRNQAWNMTYNISVKFPTPHDRWLWVRRGIELIRDDAIRYNPHEARLYFELAWYFQHKMGQTIDDHHMYYKQIWAWEMNQLFSVNDPYFNGRPKFDELINPQTEAARKTTETLRKAYNMDPVLMKSVDDQYGPLDWRLPETHAMYWAWTGLTRLKEARDIKASDRIWPRRIIYQSMQLAVQRGKMIFNKADKTVDFGPNIEIIGNANRSYEEMMDAEPETRDHITQGHKSFLQKAVSDLYIHNRPSDATKWFEYMKKTYPDVVQGNPSMEEYVNYRIEEEITSQSPAKARSILEGMIQTHLINLALGEEDAAIGYLNFAKKVWTIHNTKVSLRVEANISLPPFAEVYEQVLQRTRKVMSKQLQAELFTRLGRPIPKDEPDVLQTPKGEPLESSRLKPVPDVKP